MITILNACIYFLNLENTAAAGVKNAHSTKVCCEIHENIIRLPQLT